MKKNIIPIVAVSILGLGLIGSILPTICVANRTFIKGGELADYREFLNKEGGYTCSFTYNGSYKDVYDNDMRVMKCLKTISPTEDNNNFPYISRENTGYISYVIYHGNYIFRMDEQGQKFVISYRNQDNTFLAYKHYIFQDDDGQKLIQTFRSLVGDESNENYEI